MANFKEAYRLTGHNEGGYANNPNDHGGETYAGIARNFWPNWSGWVIIDEYKRQHDGVHGINVYLTTNNVVQTAVASFYKQNFWDVNKLDLITDQALANNIYDFGVNSGTARAAKTLQQILNIVADGIIGPQTIAATNKAVADELYNAYNDARSAFYHRLAANPGQLQFLRSWMSRIKPYQNLA